MLAVVLYQQLQVAYRASDADEQFYAWTNKKCQESPLSICTKGRCVLGNIMVFRVQSSKLSTVCYNTSTHFIDLHFVEKAFPEMLKLLEEAVYSVNKSGRRFSSMPTD